MTALEHEILSDRTAAARILFDQHDQVENARTALAEALDNYTDALADKRTANEQQRTSKEELDAATLEAEWEIGGRFVTEGNKTYLVTPDGEKRSITADERKAYVAVEARKHPAVLDATASYRKVEEQANAAADRLIVAEQRLKAANRDLDATVAILTALSHAIPGSAR